MLLADLEARGEVGQNDGGFCGDQKVDGNAESSIRTDIDLHGSVDLSQIQATSDSLTEVKTLACCAGVNTHLNGFPDGVSWTLIKPPQRKASLFY